MTDAAAMVAEPAETIEIQNVVGAADLEREFDLAALAMDLAEAEYDPERFHGLLYRTQDPKVTVMVFGSGKVTITGATSTGDMRTAFGECVTALRELGIPVGETPETEVQNIVADGDLGERLNLSAVAIGLGLKQVEYEPEQFPGLVYRLDAPAVVVLLFGTGKFVITGASERTAIEIGIETVVTQLTDLSLLDD